MLTANVNPTTTTNSNHQMQIEDERAFQLALELTMLCLNNKGDPEFDNNSESGATKKSQNTTECVPVESSSAVAEIVGKAGCRIKQLRAKTNTYIKTPQKNEPPNFVITGRAIDVELAKHEILSAAEHFSQIRLQRKNNINGVSIGAAAGQPGSVISQVAGQTSIQVRVPNRFVGLVVGPKGATIKRIQQTTNTYIISPNKTQDPLFQIYGSPTDVEKAKREIEAHIALRTGCLSLNSGFIN